MITIWAGIAWLSWAIYSARYWIKTLVLGVVSKWALVSANKVDNFPWITESSWEQITNNLLEQAKQSSAELLEENIREVRKQDNFFLITTNSGKVFKAKKVIFATWSEYKKLWINWEKEFLGKWVSYCATCDGAFYKGKDVTVVWWWNTAFTEALYLSEICKKVYIIHRGDEFKADNNLIKKAKEKKNIIFLTNEKIENILWEEESWVKWLKLKSWKEIKANWIFIAIWRSPNTKSLNWLELKKDEYWYIVVDEKQKTNLDWLYAAWDLTTAFDKVNQAVVAAAQWVLAAHSINESKLSNKKEKKKSVIWKDSLVKREKKESLIWYKEILNEEDFKKFINQWKRVSVTFSALRCGPCQELKSQFKTNKIYPLAVVDIDKSPEILNKVWKNIKSIPTTFIFEDGKIINIVYGSNYKAIEKIFFKIEKV